MSDNPNISDPNYGDWSDEQMNALATITPASIADARADALRSDAELGAMLEANETNER
jgi:hypothetical protein